MSLVFGELEIRIMYCRFVFLEKTPVMTACAYILVFDGKGRLQREKRTSADEAEIYSFSKQAELW